MFINSNNMDLYSLLFIFILLEFFESYWQKSDTLYGLITNNFRIYSQNIFLYFILHISFFYTISISFYLHNFNFWMSSIIVIKFIDISFKLTMMKKLSSGLSLEEVMPMNINMTPIFRYLNVVIYPISYIFATGLL